MKGREERGRISARNPWESRTNGGSWLAKSRKTEERDEAGRSMAIEAIGEEGPARSSGAFSCSEGERGAGGQAGISSLS